MSISKILAAAANRSACAHHPARGAQGRSVVCASIFVSFDSLPVHAQEDGTVEEVVVTGRSIRGAAAVGSRSVSIERADIRSTGLGTASEIARGLLQVINLSADEARLLRGAQDSAANTTKVNGINIRGIGTEATLVLVNGRRLAPNGVIKAVCDPSQIPNVASNAWKSCSTAPRPQAWMQHASSHIKPSSMTERARHTWDCQSSA